MKIQRTNQEYLLLALSALATFTISPFALYRFIQNEWIIAIVDLLIGIGMATVFAYVYKTRKVTLPSIVLAVLAAVSVVASIYVKGIINIYWIYPAISAAYYLLAPRWAVVLSTCTIVALLPVLYAGLEPVVFISVLTTFFMTGIFGFFFAKTAKDQHRKLTQLATRDPLTGTGNRRALDDRLTMLISAQTRNPLTVSLILFDLDHFKLINDDYGHIFGDQILIQIVGIIEARIRVTDSLYRFGGEEFVIVPLALELDSAGRLAEQLRALIENNALAPEKPVTISLGVAEYQPGESSESWMNRADKALYRAKENGRNQVCLAE